MSADLFAAFGGQPQQISGSEKRSPGQSTEIEYDQADLVPGLANSSRSNDLIDPYQTTAPPLHRKEQTLENQDPNVLFNASDDEGDSDSFGEYEDSNPDQRNVLSGRTSTRTEAVTELVLQNSSREVFPGPDSPVRPSPRGFVSTNPSDQTYEILDVEDEWGDFQRSAACPPSSTAKEKGPDIDDDPDEWPSMEDKPDRLDEPVVKGSMVVAAAPKPRVTDQKKLNEVTPGSTTSDDTFRPTNIPPPARVLELFPLVWQRLSASSKSTAPTQSSLVDQIMQSHVVCARVLAGRSLRWKRDAHLTQSMRIGPASAGKGMKLQAINRHELAKEEQEAAELLRSWATVQRRFSDLLAKASNSHNLALSLQLKPKPADGQSILKANHPCALCGLRRDERLAAVDDGVSDLFGEWWTEHWGHRDCVQFWSKHHYFIMTRCVARV